MSGIVAVAGIGLALSTGYGVSAADPTASDPSSRAGTVASADTETRDNTADSPSGSVSDDAGTEDDDAVTEDSDEDATAPDDPTDADDESSDPTEEPPADPAEESGAVDDDPTEQDGTDLTEGDDAHHGSESTGIAPVSSPSEPTDEDADTTVDFDPDAGPDTTQEPTPTVEAPSPTPTHSGVVASMPEPTAPAPVSEPATGAPGAPAGAVATLLSAFGIGGGVPAPVEAPSMWLVLAWVRRQFGDTSLAGQTTPPTGTTTSVPSSATGTTINVKDYGAVGNGIADDSAAIKAAQAAMTSGDLLYFPAGNYRFAQQNPTGQAAIVLSGLSNVTVEFAPGARLVMDNLDANGHGTSHGIRIQGAASHVTILNATIEWSTAPSTRSFGDGISVLGWPSDSPPPAGWTGSTGTVEYVSIVNVRVVNAPQAGAAIMGASDVTVTNFTAVGTKADGLHFNANRRVTLNGLLAQNTGDDGLAFVTYYDPSQPWTYGPTDGPFNQSGIGEWNNGGSVASHIIVTGGRASGVRVQGGYDITISDVTVSNKEFGLQVNSAIATGPGDWTSLASRNVHISDVTINGVQTGIVLATNNIDGTQDSKWWNFEGLTISDVTIRGATNWSVSVETPATTTSKFAGLTLQNIYAESMASDGPFGGGNGGILLASLRDSTIENVRLVADHPSDILILGASQIRGSLHVADLPPSNLTLNDVILEGPGRILIQDIAGLSVGNIESHGADGAAVELYRVKDASFANITADLPGRGSGGGFGVRLLQVHDIDIANIEVTMDDHVGSSWWAVELSGGNPTQDIAGNGVRVENVTYISDRDATDSDIAVQGGPYGPVDWYIHVTWRHNGEALPQWRSTTYGDVSPL
ncbi:glycosyl hydrolase family 28-related protein [Mycolicibacterium mengxianglii]|uniref:glycosyl hydrolase family 28-related protein n=1 Tax=Mycolicibacterium mengxianglii TaxID=2736649 RepID=UPI0018EEEFB2|nr:glycosyl hydrolase family 28-related protein [Mycolicibacterium mengxianglii]